MRWLAGLILAVATTVPGQIRYKANGTGAVSLSLAQEIASRGCTATEFGAKGDGIADDTTALQNAINNCHIVLLPDGGFKITATLAIDERSGLVLRGTGMRGFNNGTGLTGGLGSVIIWAGNTTDPAIKVTGSADVTIDQVKIFAQTSSPLDTGIRYETKTGRLNTHNALRNVGVFSDGILGSLHYGVRFVAGTGGDANNDQGMFDYLTLAGYDTAGIDINHAQSVDHRFYNLIIGSGVGTTTYGITAATGATFSVYGGGGGGHSGADFNVRGTAFSPITISDFHTENSAHFLITQGGTPINAAGGVTLIGCSFTDGSVAANGRVIDFETQGPLTIINFESNFSTAKNKSIYYDATGLDTYNFTVVGLVFLTSATNVFSNFQPTFMTGLEVVNGGGVTGQKSKYTSSEILLTYGATIATDAGLGSSFRIDPNNGTAFTVSFPTNGVKGQRLMYCIRNISGGALGVITWTSFKMAAFTNPANGFNRCIEFKFDGFNYYEIGRTTIDVPN